MKIVKNIDIDELFLPVIVPCRLYAILLAEI